MSRRQQTGDDRRGNSKDRAARKIWMLNQFGNGHSVDCRHCGTSLDYANVQADRIIPGGSYRRSNVQPSCQTCNIRRSDNRCWSCPLAALRSRTLVAA